MLWKGDSPSIESITKKLMVAAESAKNYDGELNPILLLPLDGTLAEVEREVTAMRKRVQRLSRESNATRRSYANKGRVLLNPIRVSGLE